MSNEVIERGREVGGGGREGEGERGGELGCLEVLMCCVKRMV